MDKDTMNSFGDWFPVHVAKTPMRTTQVQKEIRYSVGQVNDQVNIETLLQPWSGQLMIYSKAKCK